MATRSRGRCSGNGFLTGRLRSEGDDGGGLLCHRDGSQVILGGVGFQIFKLKFDQSFVRDLGNDTNDRAIVSAIIRMAQALGMRTTAEGVETESQLAFLHEQGCDEAQGYHFSTPLPAEQLERFMRQHTAAH